VDSSFDYVNIRNDEDTPITIGSSSTGRCSNGMLPSGEKTIMPQPALPSEDNLPLAERFTDWLYPKAVTKAKGGSKLWKRKSADNVTIYGNDD